MKPTIPDPDDLDLIEQQLFRSLAGDEPSKQARRVTAVALGLGTATLTTTTAGAGGVASSIAAKTGPLLIVKWIGLGTLAGAVSLGAVRYANRPADHVASPSARTAEDAAPVVVARSPEALAPKDRPEETRERLIAEPRASTLAPPSPELAPRRTIDSVVERSAVRRADTKERFIEEAPAAASHQRPASMLAAEVAALDDVRNAIAAKDGDRALWLLRRYASEFPTQTLNIEATVLRIEALFTDGQSQAARDLARDFLAAHPTSTLATRVRHLLALHEKP